MSYVDKDLPAYPKGAGYRDDEASRDGARKVNRDGSRTTHCAVALAAVERAGPDGISSTAIFELPDAPFRDLSLCRARLSDLKKLGKIVKKGERTPGSAGVAVNVWIASHFASPPNAIQEELFRDG